MDKVEYLTKRGWVRIIPIYNTLWVWQQPKTGALFQLDDAVEVEQALDRAVKIGKQQ